MIFTRPRNRDLDSVHDALAQLIDELNRFHPPIQLLPVFDDDTAAATANLKINRPYVTPDGTIRRRMG